MGFHVGAVDRDGAANLSHGGQRLVDLLPDATPGPAVLDGRQLNVFGGTIPPRAAGQQDVQNTADHSTIINAAGARLVVGQQWLDD